MPPDSTVRALDFSNAVFMMCGHSLMVEIRGVAPIAGVDVNPNQHCSRLESWPGGNSFKIRSRLKEPWEILAAT